MRKKAIIYIDRSLSIRGIHPLLGGADLVKSQMKRPGWVADTSTSSVEIQNAQVSDLPAGRQAQLTMHKESKAGNMHSIPWIKIKTQISYHNSLIKMMRRYSTIFSFLLILFIISSACGNNDTLTHKETTLSGSIESIDKLMRDFMTKYNVPGLSVAIAKDGSLVYAKGYGYANKSTGEKVMPSSLFRIASISKPFTSVAIFQLIEGGKLSLNATVFGDSGILGNDYGKPPYQPGITKITVHELLQHTGGGWSNNMNDPMFTNPSLSASGLISWTVSNMPLENEPGAVYAYSNFGYCVLGRIIEKLSGMKYEEYVKTYILKKAGITDMTVGGNTLADRKNNEVIYYSQGGEDPYVYNIQRMDSHGGWIASATDLLKFTWCVDGFPTKPDILSEASLKLMTEPSAANKNYACGWAVNDANNWWHGGSLPGTATEMVRAHNGFCWAILASTRTWQKGFTEDMDQLVWRVLKDTTIQWNIKEQL